MRPSEYEVDIQAISESAYVDTGQDHYMVLSHYKKAWKTYVFLHIMKPDTWILRREIIGKVDPLPAVTGTELAGRNELHWDPLLDLKERLRRTQRAYERVLDELLESRRRGKVRHVARKRQTRRIQRKARVDQALAANPRSRAV